MQHCFSVFWRGVLWRENGAHRNGRDTAPRGGATGARGVVAAVVGVVLLTRWDTRGGKLRPASGRGARSRAAKPAPWGELAPGETSLARSASNLIFAAAILEKKTGEREALAAQAASRSESASCDSSGVTVGPRGGSAARSAFQTSEDPQQSGFFSTVEENESPFIPILPADVSAVASSGEVFRSLGSKTDPVLHVRFPRPWSVVAENPKIQNWRCLLNLVKTAVLGDE